MKYGSITTGIIADGLVFNMDPANRASTIPSTSTLKTFNTLDTSISGSIVTDATWTNSTITPSFAFDGTDGYVNFGDNDLYSFGNGSSDSPFSTNSWVNMTDATDFLVFVKDADSGKEWTQRFYLDKFRAYLIDHSTGGYIGRFANALDAAEYQNQWINFSMTYNGNSTSAGMKLYLNGIRIDDEDYEAGSYTAMENTGTSLRLGAQERGSNESYGYIATCQIYNRELSANEVLHNYNELKGRFGL